jgi:hypothetical protein
MNDIWTNTSEGYCTEASMIRDQGTFIKLPDGTIAAINLFTPHRDNENEITHWSLTRFNNTFTIFND